MEKNDRILCKITGVQPYGVFVEYQDFQGLIHISEVSDRYVMDIHKLFVVDEWIYAVVLDIDENQKKLQLSYKKALLIHPKVLQMVDIKKGFRSIENKLEDWIKDKKES